MRLLAGSYGTIVPWPVTKVDSVTVPPPAACTVADAPGVVGLVHMPLVGSVWQIDFVSARLRGVCPIGVSVGVNVTVQGVPALKQVPPMAASQNWAMKA